MPCRILPFRTVNQHAIPIVVLYAGCQHSQEVSPASLPPLSVLPPSHSALVILMSALRFSGHGAAGRSYLTCYMACRTLFSYVFGRFLARVWCRRTRRADRDSTRAQRAPVLASCSRPARPQTERRRGDGDARGPDARRRRPEALPATGVALSGAPDGTPHVLYAVALCL